MLRNPNMHRISVKALPIRIAGTERNSVVDGPGVRFVIFTQGCFHNCPGCHNPHTHDINGGHLTDTAELWKLIDSDPLIEGITFSGGEPFLWGKELAEIAAAAHKKNLNILTFSGFTFEQLAEKAESDDGIKALLTESDYLIDGPFILEERDLMLKFRGSRNQRVLDITAYPNRKTARPADFI